MRRAVTITSVGVLILSNLGGPIVRAQTLATPVDSQASSASVSAQSGLEKKEETKVESSSSQTSTSQVEKKQEQKKEVSDSQVQRSPKVSTTVLSQEAIAPVKIATDLESLQKMLSVQRITGTGEVGATITIKNGSNTWTGEVDAQGNFSLSTPGLKKGDTIEVTESKGDQSSAPVTITFTSSAYNVTLTGPKYLIIDPQKQTAVDETGHPASLTGNWSGSKANEKFGFVVNQGSSQKWWYDIGSSSKFASVYPEMFQNNGLINAYHWSLSKYLSEAKEGDGSNYDKLSNLPTNVTYTGGTYINNGSGERDSSLIPLYIKAPQVSVDQSVAAWDQLKAEGLLSGTGQAGDTVTVVNKGQSYQATVGSDGHFSVKIENFSLGDRLTITEVNGTGEHSVSDPVELYFPKGKVEPEVTPTKGSLAHSDIINKATSNENRSEKRKLSKAQKAEKLEKEEKTSSNHPKGQSLGKGSTHSSKKEEEKSAKRTQSKVKVKTLDKMPLDQSHPSHWLSIFIATVCGVIISMIGYVAYRSRKKR